MLARGKRSALWGGIWYGPPGPSGSPPAPVPSSGIALEIPMQSSLPRREGMEAGVRAVYSTNATAYILYIWTYSVRIHTE